MRVGIFAKREAAQPFGHDLSDFRILREIGRGGMGVVYGAEQLSLGRRVALKVLPLAATLTPQQLERFKNEARADGTQVESQPYSSEDLMATVCQALDISLQTTFTSNNGRPMKIANGGQVIPELFG